MVVNLDWLQLSIYKVGFSENVSKADLEPITLATYVGNVLAFFNEMGGDFPVLRCFDTDKELVKDVFMCYKEGNITDSNAIYLGSLMMQRWDIRDCTLKIENDLLYKRKMVLDGDLYRQIQRAIENSGWTFKHITRCDIAVDFCPLSEPVCERYTKPSEFISDIVSNRVKRCSNGAARATLSTQQKKKDEMTKIVKSAGDFSYIRFSNYLPTSVLYNKSLEMRMKSLKSYIVDDWLRAGFDDTDNDIWRFELRFNFKGSAFSEHVCNVLHKSFMSSPTLYADVIKIVQTYIDTRVRFLGVDKMKKVRLFDLEQYIKLDNVSNCNLTEYKLYAKLPRVSSYHIGLCKFLRGFVRDCSRGLYRVNNVPINDLKSSADFILEQINDLILCRDASSVASCVDVSFYSQKSKTLRKLFDDMDEEQRRILLEINVLHSELKTARKTKKEAEKFIEEHITELIYLKQFLKENCAVSPV